MEERFAFDQIANVYKVARPDYPEALIEDVVSYADLKQGDPILEVGCGTGQATKSFAKRGFPIVAMDPGPEMLRVARDDLAGFSNVELLETTFEAWPANRGAFRLIVAAQSWHWVSPEMRFQAPLLIVATTRPEFRPDWSLRSHHSVISLAPLDRAQVRRMVGEIATLHALSDGRRHCDGLLGDGVMAARRG